MTNPAQSPPRVDRKPVLFILTGLSGSGKSTALAAFEDAGYYCVDNLPVKLLPLLLTTKEVIGGGESAGLTCVMDVREKGFLGAYSEVFDRLRQEGFPFQILFFEAQEPVLIQRYSQTRRQHPLAVGKGLVESIRTEREQLEPLRRIADRVIDTSALNVHDLKALVRQIADRGRRTSAMRITVMSFGFKYGLPLNADLVLDVRFLPNPYFVPELKPFDGRHPEVRAYVFQDPRYRELIERYEGLVAELIPLYEKEGKSYLTLAVGCTGGMHRSVAVAEWFARDFQQSFPNVSIDVLHRDVEQNG
uniref:RNase adapter RapZ n=1 Tax=Desulfatirhabdium butyrativorans TaxID=340467 RepID=A0A7C4MLF4_9BACT